MEDAFGRGESSNEDFINAIIYLNQTKKIAQKTKVNYFIIIV